MDFVVSCNCDKIQLKSMWRKQEEAYASHKDGGYKHQNVSIVSKISMVMLHYIQ